uniref:Envelope glycoprotein n=1 Tax=Equine infectious anemia virus TaxID=11665 RepID=E9KU87_9RETR|nr:envelope polyprotein [Equine infectious anemia virus]
MVSIAFYGGIPGGVSTPITQQTESTDTQKGDHMVYQPYCYNDSHKAEMAEARGTRYQEEMNRKEDKEDKRRNNWWKIGMFLLCLLGTTGGFLWWYEGQHHSHYIGLVTIGGRLNGSGMTSAIECWGSFPGCRPFTNYFSYETNRTVSRDNNTATLLDAYQREITNIYRTSCVDSDHCQEYKCKQVQLKENSSNIIMNNCSSNSCEEFRGFSWLECNQTENAITILVPDIEMQESDNNTWIPKRCNETWARVKHCPMDLLYGINRIRMCVQPPFFLFKQNDTSNNTGILSNCGPLVFLGILEDNKAAVQNGSCTLHRTNIKRPDYSGFYQVPIFYICNLTGLQSCNNGSIISIIMYESNNVQYLLCNTSNTNSTNNANVSCVVQSFGVIGQAHVALPRKNKRLQSPKFAHYNCSINNKTELRQWQLVKTSGITPLPISSTANTGLVRHKRDFGISAIIAAIVAATAIAASATMSYIALTEVNKLDSVQNHTFEVENNTINSMELIEEQIHILYAMVLQTHADVQLLKEQQKIEETFNLIGCIERSHTFCHTGHPWNESWGQLNDSTQWDDWVNKMENLNHDILTTLHTARNNLDQSMITFNTPDSIAQFGKNIWSHIANWIPGLGASIIKYIVLLLLVYVLLTSAPKILRGLLTTMSGAGSSASRYLRKRYHHRHASRGDIWAQVQYHAYLADETHGSGDKSNMRKLSRNNWNGESEEYNRRQKNWKRLIKRSGENYNTHEDNMGTMGHLITTAAEKKNVGENPHQGSLNLEIQSEGGNIYDCCIKAQEGTLAIPCCGFPLWLLWGLIIILGRLLGYGLRGIAKIITILGKGLNVIITGLRKLCDYIGKMLNPATSHVTMPQYDV